jgi:ACS family D-galactonate transporter-like MFS transporter
MTSTVSADQKPTRARYLVMAMLFITVVINYLDRSNLSITVPAMKAEFGIDNKTMGLVLGAFAYTYAGFQIPGGWLVDRLTPRIFYPVILVLWSLATVSMSIAGTVTAFFLIRMLIGALEAPAYSINNQVVTSWFPNRERGGAIGFFISGQFVGTAFLTPVLFWLEAHYGWRTVFYSTGCLGLLWGIAWYFLYRTPRESRLANTAEIDYIVAGGALIDLGTASAVQKPKLRLADFGTVLKYRKLWGVYIGQFAVTSSQFFFLTWFPTYLIEARHLSIIKTGFYASVPFIGAFLGALCSGFVSDLILRSGFTIGTARKAPIVTGLLISSVIIGANYVASPELVIAFMTLAFFGNGMASIGWSLISSVAPRRLIGLTGGMFNGISNLSGIATPMIIGILAQHGNFAPGLAYIAAVAVIGALAYIFMIGKLEPVEA